MSYNRYGSTRGFSSRSQGSIPSRAAVYRSTATFQPGLRSSTSGLVSKVPFLLSSLPNLEIDPKIHQLRSQEKEQIKGLNNQFVSFIEKVRDLEQQNKVLETRLQLLKDKDTYKSNINQVMTASSNNLKQQIDGLLHEKQRLQTELTNMEAVLEDLKNKYEDEINRHNQLENDFVLTKKDLDDTYLQKVDTESKLGSITDEIEYLKRLFDEEIQELQSQVQNTMVTVEMDNSRDLEMKSIIEDVKAQYQAMLDKSRQEAEQWYNSKFDDMKKQAKRNSEELKNVKSEIMEINRLTQRTNGDIEALKNQRANLENAIAVAEEQGEQAIQNAKKNIQEIEEGLKRSKQDMAHKMREYQEVMNTKLALDIEIATYKKLLEGEENRMCGQLQNPQLSAINSLAGLLKYDLEPVTRATAKNSAFAQPTISKKPVLIKTIETLDGVRLSEANHFSEK
ncbi:keratin, type II cytoskeletal 8 [Microcaecilia unicolor]|uniref:Keratin, type II cytoskeletal 8-like n=1 Tax=Microcaecilia unicolor TaxID=1415580 RepID=A0A6P7YQC8_9AMPH|nr:keratin, type II cytoskeletal 8-like [Microcaecilia unicolor]